MDVAATKPGPGRIDRLILHLAVTANTIGIGVILALLADLRDAYGLPTAGMGLVAASAFITSFIGFVTLARFADMGHAKTMLMLGTTIGAVALVMAALARNLWMLVLARAVLGLAEGAFVPAARRVVLDWAPDRPGEVLGRILAAAVTGFALGPLIGAVLADHFGLQVPFLVPAGILLMAVPVVARLQAPPPVPPVAGRRLLGLMRSRLVVAGLILGSIEFASFGAFDAIWAILLTDLGASTSFVGLSFTLIAGPLIFLATPFGRLIDRRSPLPISALGMVLLLPAVAAYGRLGAPITLALAGVVHAAASAAIGPAGAALVARGSPPDMIARGQGLLEAVGFLAAAATALPSGWAYDTVGRGVWFGGLAGLLAVLFLVAWRLGRPSSAGDGAALPRGSG